MSSCGWNAYSKRWPGEEQMHISTQFTSTIVLLHNTNYLDNNPKNVVQNLNYSMSHDGIVNRANKMEHNVPGTI